MWQGSADGSEAGVEAELPPERDSPAAQAGSEPQVSHEIDATIHNHPDGPPALLVGEEMATPLRGGTTSSNPSCSSGESLANLIDVSTPVIAGQLLSSRGEKTAARGNCRATSVAARSSQI